MSTALRTDLGSTSVDASLTEIDARSKDPRSSNKEDIAVGPFGVLNFNLNATFTQSQNVHTDDASAAEELPTDTPSTFDSLMNLDDSLQWADLFELDFDNMLITQQAPFVSGVQDFFYDSYNIGNHEPLPLSNGSDTTTNRPQSAQNHVATDTALPEPLPSLVGIPASELELPADTQTLLKHFQDHVIAQMAALPIGSKSPWKILNLSSAVETLAEVTFLGGQNVKHAHAANFYGPLVNTISDRGDGTRRTDTSKTHTGHNARLDDFLRLKAHQSDSDLEIEEPKDSEIGLHDIHLEDSREFSDHMYLQIYGIPETWLSLVSQTTRLANVMDAVKTSSKETSMGLLESLEKRGARLENMICSFASKTLSTTSTTSTQPTEGNNDGGLTFQLPQSLTPNDHMLRALNSALVIFFYRRIRNVNPWILQGHVDDVIQALQEFDTALLRQGLEGPGTMWPAFMAGCEAMAASKRDALMRWIEKGASKSGLYGFKAAKGMMAELWRRRDEANAATSSGSARSVSSSGTSSTASRGYRRSHTPWTWVDVSRERDLWLMLC
ncbi:hypothetical protein H2201_005782 [Coniosporium apollinis]|uniref:Transcription factor domain-containing protein n=2 Tax=Coniosporium TaxID=2810619 RepID=A0ABQ9NPL4_9PEZI|nr:hypothetical protein H2199_008393 [Cladosporium sp. JES 115]KAJ9663111.1 hypothetical protein H2201_005782 [Coniosporium apollinis]